MMIAQQSFIIKLDKAVTVGIMKYRNRLQYHDAVKKSGLPDGEEQT